MTIIIITKVIKVIKAVKVVKDQRTQSRSYALTYCCSYAVSLATCPSSFATRHSPLATRNSPIDKYVLYELYEDL